MKDYLSSFCSKRRKALGVDCGSRSKVRGMYFMPLNCALKSAGRENYTWCEFLPQTPKLSSFLTWFANMNLSCTCIYTILFLMNMWDIIHTHTHIRACTCLHTGRRAPTIWIKLTLSRMLILNFKVCLEHCPLPWGFGLFFGWGRDGRCDGRDPLKGKSLFECQGWEGVVDAQVWEAREGEKCQAQSCPCRAQSTHPSSHPWCGSSSVY